MGNETSIRRRIREKYNEMPENFQRVAKYIIDHYYEIVYLSVNELAEKIGVSDTMVIRFAKYLGFNGYSDMRALLKDEAYNKSVIKGLENMQQYSGDENYALNYLRTNAKNLQSYIELIDFELIDTIVTKIIDAKHLYIGGLGVDVVVAQYLFSYLRKMGFDPIRLTEEGYAMRESLLHIGSQDVLIMCSFPKTRSDEIIMARTAKEHGATLITFTNSESTAMLLESDYYLAVRQPRNTFFNSYVTQMALCELLLIRIYERIPEQVDAGIREYVNAIKEEGDDQ